jgi:hypothetical protein
MATLITLLPGFPLDLIYILLDYVPGIALQLPTQERIDVVRRLTGLNLSEERASLVLEQRDVRNRDFDDLTLAADDKAWCEATRMACSPRAFDELVRLGHFELRLVYDHRIESFVCHAAIDGGDQGLALLQHLERMGSKTDVLCQGKFFYHMLRKVSHPPTLQYLLCRLLNADDPCFVSRKQQLLSGLPEFARAYFSTPPGPYELLVFDFYWGFLDWSELKRSGWSSVPLLQALVTTYTNARTLLLHFDVLQMMFTKPTRTNGLDFVDLITDTRPLGRFTFGWKTTIDAEPLLFSITYGPFTREWHSILANTPHPCSWIVDDWLLGTVNEANQATRWKGFVELFWAVKLHRHVLLKLIEGVPDHVLTTQITQHPKLLATFYNWSSVPSRLLTLVPFDIWIAGLAGFRHKSHPNALRFLSARQRVLLHDSQP